MLSSRCVTTKNRSVFLCHPDLGEGEPCILAAPSWDLTVAHGLKVAMTLVVIATKITTVVLPAVVYLVFLKVWCSMALTNCSNDGRRSRIKSAGINGNSKSSHIQD